MRAAISLAIALLIACSAAARAAVPPTVQCAAARRWESLPPTPLLPRPERQGYAPGDGARLWYGEYGRRNGGTPVLLLHGGLANSSYYGRLIPALVGAGYRVIAMDSRGHGRSTASEKPYSYRLLAADAVAVLDRLGVAKADIVGWSDGGTAGYQLALDAPGRIGRLLAFGANASLDGLKPGYAATPTFAAYIARTAGEYRQTAPQQKNYTAFLEAISAMWGASPFESVNVLRRIKAPVTVMVGQYDEALSIAHAEEIAASIPTSNLVVLPDVSHFAVLQCPAEFDQAVLAFLRWR